MSNFAVSNASNISSNESSELGGLAYFLTNISECLPYVILLSFGSIIGVLGNIVVMLTIIVNKELHSSTYILMFNLALADLFVNVFVDSGAIFSLLIGEKFFINRPEICIFLGIMCFLTVNTSLFTLGLIAINRYINICRNHLYKKLFTTKLTIFYCFLIWILAFINNLPNLTGWNYYTYDKKGMICIWNRKSNLSYKLYLTIVNIVIPFLGIIFCYSRIYVFSNKSKNRSNSSSVNSSIRLAKSLFASFMLYMICWSPIGLVLLVDLDDFVSSASLVMFPVALAFLNSSLNPIIYAVFNSNFRSACGHLFEKICCCLNLRNNTVSASGNHLSDKNANNLQNRVLYNS